MQACAKGFKLTYAQGCTHILPLKHRCRDVGLQSLLIGNALLAGMSLPTLKLTHGLAYFVVFTGRETHGRLVLGDISNRIYSIACVWLVLLTDSVLIVSSHSIGIVMQL